MLLVGWRGGHPACKKTERWGASMVICLEQGADLHMTQRISLPLTVSCFSKIQIGFTFLVPAHPGRGRQRVCVCMCVCILENSVVFAVNLLIVMINMVFSCLLYFVCVFTGFLPTSYTAHWPPKTSNPVQAYCLDISMV